MTSTRTHVLASSSIVVGMLGAICLFTSANPVPSSTGPDGVAPTPQNTVTTAPERPSNGPVDPTLTPVPTLAPTTAAPTVTVTAPAVPAPTVTVTVTQQSLSASCAAAVADATAMSDLVSDYYDVFSNNQKAIYDAGTGIADRDFVKINAASQKLADIRSGSAKLVQDYTDLRKRLQDSSAACVAEQPR